MASLSLFSTAAVFLLDTDGHRILAKYYQPLHLTGSDGKPALIGGQPGYVSPFKTLKDQRAFEQGVWEKTRKATGDILLYNGHLVLYKSSIDLTFYVVGPEGENELMLSTVLNAFYDAVSILLRHQVEKRAILENLDLVVLCLDETIDDGIILETDSNAICARVSRPRADVGAVDLSNITINEQTIMQAFSTVRDKMAQRILQGSCCIVHDLMKTRVHVFDASEHSSMEGILLCDSSCRPILSTHFRSRYVASSCLDVLASEIASARETGTEVPAVLKLPALSVPAAGLGSSAASGSSSEDSSDEEEDDRAGYEDPDGWQETKTSKAAPAVSHGMICCHWTRNNVRYVVPVSSAVDPILVFAFLEALLRVFEDYWSGSQINEGLIRDNFDTVLLLLEEMLGTSRYPLLSEVATLKELVTPPSLVAKLLSAATSALSAGPNTPAGQMAPTNNAALSSPLPWRKQGIRHKSNEIFFDIFEELGGIVDRTGQFIVSEVWGQIQTKCKLTGMPDLNMTLSHAANLEDCSFHPCVRLSQWTKSKTLSFIPPEGRFTLMSYRLGPPTRNQPASVLPLQLKPVVTVGEAGGSLTLTLSSRLPSARVIENVVIAFRLRPHATSVSAIASGGRAISMHDRGVAVDEAPPAGRWDFDARTSVLTWTVARLTSGDRPVVLSGTWQSSRPNARPASSILLSFLAPLVNVSGMRVDSLKVSGDTPAPYKGVRPMLQSGSLEFRW